MRLGATIVALLLYVPGFCQHKDPVPKDDTMFIISSLSEDSLFTDIGKRLVRSGFTLATTNREFGQISTSPKLLIEYSFSYSLVVVIEGNKAEIKPTIISTIIGNYRWYFIKAKSTKNYIAMADILKTFEGLGEVRYDKKG